MATSWSTVRAGKTMRKSTMLLDLNQNKSDIEIWENFNALIDEDIVSDYMVEFCSILSEAQTPIRVSLVTEYLPSVIPTRKQELALFAVAICLNHGETETALQHIEQYKNQYGEDKEILVEELNYYNSFSPENTEEIQALVAAIQAFGEM